MIERVDSSVDRCRSVSSMRSRNSPRVLGAKSQKKGAERAARMWRYPVGDGAKRTRTDISGGDDRIRTCEGLLTLNGLANRRLQPLGHISVPISEDQF